MVTMPIVKTPDRRSTASVTDGGSLTTAVHRRDGPA